MQKSTYIWVFAALCFALTACGKGQQDPSVASIVNDFIVDASVHGKNLSVNNEIQFGNVQASGGVDGAVGVCTHDNIDNLFNGKIVLDQTYWNMTSELNKKMILYHELGHCVLGRSHRLDLEALPVLISIPGTSTLDVPVSIMYPTFPSETQIDSIGPSYYEALIRELFQ